MLKPRKVVWIVLALGVLVALGVVLYFTLAKDADKKPNIIIIIADDLGRNDVGFHGSSQIPTPNIDALAYSGVILDRFYTQCACTPSRTALLTGKYPIRTGMQGLPLRAGETRYLPSDVPLMPELFKGLGYHTHLVGKWHLGFSYRSNTPLGRGFDSHFGYWDGFVGYFDYVGITPLPNGTIWKGFNLYDGFTPQWGLQGRYATQLFTEKTLEVIDQHNEDDPLFLVLAHLAAHTGKNGLELEVPDVNITNDKYPYIKDPQRRRYADIVNLMDKSVGQVVKKLSEKNLLDNSIVVFLSDNGGQSTGHMQNYASNWPLRGQKMTEFEGGVRGTAAIFSPLLHKTGYVNKNLMHITDLLPTLFAAAGGSISDLGVIDGINQWPTLSENQTSTRHEVLLNIDEVADTSAIIVDQHKLIQGVYLSGDLDQYYGESGRGVDSPSYNFTAVADSAANRGIHKTTNLTITKELVDELRRQSDVSWCRFDDEEPFLNCSNGCLFDLTKDPCEKNNLISVEVEMVGRIKERLEEFKGEVVPQKNTAIDPASDPALYNNTWCTWLDDGGCYKTTNIERLQ